MDNKRWSLRISDNPEVINWYLGDHFSIWNGYFDDGPIIPLLSSRHVDAICEEEASTAYAKLKTIYRLVNGLSMLNRGRRTNAVEQLSLHEGIRRKPVDIKHDKEIMFQELLNPFIKEVVDEIDKERDEGSYYEVCKDTDYVELIVKDDLIREAVLLLSLTIEDEFYLLVNAYKILEIIRNDMGFKQKDGSLVEDENSKKYSFENVFELQEYAGYMNNKGASGLLSRHGFSKKNKEMTAPKYDDFIDLVIKSVSEWINYKCIVHFGRTYPTAKGLYRFKVSSMTDEDLQF